MDVVSKEVAKAEIDKWLDYKKVGDRKREALESNIEALCDAICDGVLVVDDKFNLVQKLLFPIGVETIISELTFKPRMTMASVHNHLNGVKSTDADGRMCAWIAALTSKPKDIIKALETEDYAIGQTIAGFFI